jgi:hypothetical protein
MGKKRIRGIPILHDELKKTRGLDLTDTAWEIIAIASQVQGLSKSEFVEQWARALQTKQPEKESDAS